MPIDFSDFHFLRPALLYLLIPTLLAFYGLKHLAKKQSGWNQVISPHLLKFLMITGEKRSTRTVYWISALLMSAIIFSASGPTFRQKPVPIFQKEIAKVILLDLSLSMDATDIKPSRIARSRHKVLDFLEQNKEGTIGLIVYAGDAFIISPLTSDANTIAALVPTLSTGIMPVLGSRPDLGVKRAIELLDNAKQSTGQIIWVTDGIDEEFTDEISKMVSDTSHLLSILAVGTDQGAPIPLPDNNGFLKDTSGNIILPKLEAEGLKQIANENQGQYVELSANSDDINYILKLPELQQNNDANHSDERINRWIDDGYWLTWLILLLMSIKLIKRNDLPLFSLSFVNLSLPAIVLSVFATGAFTPSVKAGVWDDLWLTKNQQANQAFEKNDYGKAAELFEDSNWKAAANYKNQKYDAAISQYQQMQSKLNESNLSVNADDFYNLGNSLAKAQQLEPAIKAYEKALTSDPNHEDAKFNKKIVEELLKQQQEQKKQDQENQEQQDKKNQDQEQNQCDQQNQQDSQEKSDQEQQSDQEKKEQEQQSQEQSEEQKQQEQKQAELQKDNRDKNEKDQALEHWLEKIPDDPGGLLRRKMYREYQRRGREQKEKKIW